MIIVMKNKVNLNSVFLNYVYILPIQFSMLLLLHTHLKSAFGNCNDQNSLIELCSVTVFTKSVKVLFPPPPPTSKNNNTKATLHEELCAFLLQVTISYIHIFKLTVCGGVGVG